MYGMSKHRKLLSAAFVTVMAMVVGTAPAMALRWAPNENVALLESTNLSLTIGTETISCEVAAGEGTLGKESSTWTTTPVFTECGTSQIKAGSAWTVTAVNTGEATLTIPEGEKAGVAIELSSKCKILIGKGGVLGTANNLGNGANRAQPSLLIIAEQKVAISGTSKECGESATTATINANFALSNFSKENEAIRVLGTNGGPFWHHRATGEKGEGFKIEEKAPETLSGEGGQQILSGEVGGTKVEISAGSVQAKGILYNSSLQGQYKVLLKYNQLKLNNPVLTGCEPTIGAHNEMKTEGHLAWSGIVFTPTPIEEGVSSLPKGTFTEITLKGSGCGVLAGKFVLGGAFSATVSPLVLGEWTTRLAARSSAPVEQFFWNGKVFVGVEPKLTLAEHAATLLGVVETVPAVQEIAIFEK
jgi:hypothetical protein